MNILYIGSGKSSNLVHQIDLFKYFTVALNNAWRHFTDTKLDIWMHSGDFPHEWRPANKSNILREVTFPEYEDGVAALIKKVRPQENKPSFYVGYTMFFLGLYFLANEFTPKKISLIGFDHDYNPEKVEIWNKVGRPNPQNNFKREQKNASIKDALDKVFEGTSTDSFYGHGTPDPLRLGKEHLINKFEQAKIIFNEIGIELVNLSPVISEINTIKKELI